MAVPAPAEAGGGRQRALAAGSPVDYMSITSFPRLPEEEAGGAAEGGLRARKEEDAFLGEQDTGEGRRPSPPAAPRAPGPPGARLRPRPPARRRLWQARPNPAAPSGRSPRPPSSAGRGAPPPGPARGAAARRAPTASYSPAPPSPGGDGPGAATPPAAAAIKSGGALVPGRTVCLVVTDRFPPSAVPPRVTLLPPAARPFAPGAGLCPIENSQNPQARV